MEAKRKRKAPWFLIGAIILMIYGAACGGYLLYDYLKLRSALSVQTKARDMAVATEELARPESTDPVTGKALPLGYDRLDEPMKRVITHNAMAEINSDYFAWLYLPDTMIDNYVLLEPDLVSNRYLWKDIYRKYSAVGSLMTHNTINGTSGMVRTIFGHHLDRMQGMFTELMDFRDPAFAEAHPYVYVYYRDRVERWQLWAAENIRDSHEVYTLPQVANSTEYEAVLSSIAAANLVTPLAEPNGNTEILVLSTCDRGYGGETGRFIVAYVPDAVYYYDDDLFVKAKAPDYSRNKPLPADIRLVSVTVAGDERNAYQTPDGSVFLDYAEARARADEIDCENGIYRGKE